MLPLIHEELAQYRKWTDKLICYDNVCCHLKYHRGDVERGFKEADQIFEDTFTSQSVYQAYLEPKGALASISPEGKLTIWSSTQTPFIVRSDIGKIKSFRQRHVQLNGPALPSPAQGIPNVHIDFGAIKGAVALVGFIALAV